MRDLEDVVRELVEAMLEGLGVRTQEDFQDREEEVFEELENLKDDLESYLMETVEDLPADDLDLDDDEDDDDSIEEEEDLEDD